MENKEPVYNFLGFVLHEVSHKHVDEKQPKSVFIKLSKSGYVQEPPMYVINIEVELKYNESNSVFKFEAAFAINDKQWFDSMEKEILDSVFVATAFPFIRSKIFEITSDVRPGVFLPTIDMRQVDVYKGVMFTLNENK